MEASDDNSGRDDIVARGGSKRQWLTREQSQKVEELYKEWHGDWRGHEPELEKVAKELGMRVSKA